MLLCASTAQKRGGSACATPFILKVVPSRAEQTHLAVLRTPIEKNGESPTCTATSPLLCHRGDKGAPVLKIGALLAYPVDMPFMSEQGIPLFYAINKKKLENTSICLNSTYFAVLQGAGFSYTGIFCVQYFSDFKICIFMINISIFYNVRTILYYQPCNVHCNIK